MKKKQSSIGCLFWIALILLVIVVFLFNRDTIESVMKNTGFLDIIKNEKPKEPEKPEVTRRQDDSERPKDETSKPEEQKPEQGTPQQVTGKPETTDTSYPTPQKKPELTPKDEKPELPSETVKNVRNSKLYFAVVDEAGEISLTSVVRPITYVDSPLFETIKTLTKGLTPSELNRGYLSLIPEKAELKSAIVRDGIAYLDFSEDFRFNSFGVEGYKTQLKQVIYTATEFSNVKLVQITIEGQKHQYLAPEGIFIGAPLSRESF
jgi:spore germination protein GerM